ncbi:hypothetical protein FA95DRAFT_1580496 [Auriscalpium vulgare]|uniref:Uncharacterized protein n=1 Tax=Auriscalpium vulgare TaxID=40419 RepID=A0ACB8S5K5_9AGAM|nr:hypothetical protein FA95DRAFT_1580496 [Auriscalpium vulgare]
MARLSVLALLALSLFSVSHATPLGSQETLAVQEPPVHTTEGWSWSDCGLSTDPIQIESIDVSPDPPKPGQNMTVTVKASAVETVEEGAYADVTVKLGLIKLLQKQFDLCEEARNADTTVKCPVDKGSYEVVQTVELPKEIPKAKFSVDVRAYTYDDEDLFCVNLKVDFMKKFPLKFGW